MSTIYVDVFLLYNFLIDAFLLYLTGKILKMHTSPWIILGALTGGLYSFFAIIGISEYISLVFVRLLVLYVMIRFSFAGKFITHLKAMGMFLLVSFMFCGVLLAANMTLGNGFIVIDGYPVFLNGYLLLFCCMFISVFFGVIGIRYAVKKFTLRDIYKEVKITFNEKTVVLNALVDTGHNVFDYVNNCPVILINKEYAEFDGCKVHMIDISTVNGPGTVLCITPKRVEIEGKIYKATVGICDKRIEGYDALLSANMFVLEGEYV